MELSEFVERSLTEVVKGVADSQEAIRELGGFANPAVHIAGEEGQSAGKFGRLQSGQNVLLIDFDVAVTVTGAEAENLGGKLTIATIFSAGAEVKSENTSEATSRIKFKIPLALPVDPDSKKTLEVQDRNKSTQLARLNQNQRSFEPV